jgi:hypothetical protein
LRQNWIVKLDSIKNEVHSYVRWETLRLEGTLDSSAFRKQGGRAMLMFLAGGILIGALLSLRLNVIVLMPVTGAALMIAAVGGAARGDSFWYIVSTMVLVVTALQVGYLGGSALLAVTSYSRPSNRSREEMSGRMSRPI